MAVDLEEKTGFTPKNESDAVFDSIVNTPDMQALDDQGSTMARDSLNAKEQDPDVPNVFGYLSENGLMSNKPQTTTPKGFIAKHKAKLLGGSLAVVSFGGFFTMMMPLKLIGIMESIGGIGTIRVEGYVQKRVKKVILTSVMERLGVADRSVVKNGSMISRIAKTMTANKYEERLLAKGIEFVKGDDGLVRVRAAGVNTDEISDFAKRIFTNGTDNADDLARALDGVPLTKKVMNQLVMDDLGAKGFFLRGHLTPWMRSYLGISKWGKNKPKGTSAEEKIASAQADDIASANKIGMRSADIATDVLTNPNAGDDGARVTGEGKAAVKGALSDAVEDTASTATKATSKATMEIAESAGKRIADTLIGKVGSKAIPIYGQVTFAATVVVLANTLLTNPAKVQRALALPAAFIMMSTYANWAGLASQNKLDDLDHSLYNYYLPFLDGVETSALHNCTDTNWQTDCDKKGLSPYKKINETGGELVAGVQKFSSGFGFAIGNNSPVTYAARIIFELDNLIMGAVMSVAIEAIKAQVTVVEWAIPDGIKNQIANAGADMLENMTNFAAETITKAFGLEISPLMGGNKLYDILVNGSVYSGNQYAEKSLGLHPVSTQTASLQTQRYLAEKQDLINSKGSFYALFSPEVNTSATSRLLSGTSASGGVSGVLSSLAKLVKSTPSTLAGLTSNKVSAESYTSPEEILNIIPFGMTDAELEAPLHESLYSNEPCPALQSSSGLMGVVNDIGKAVSGSEFNNCYIDQVAAKVVECSLDTAITETGECNPDVGSNSDSTDNTGSSPGTLASGEVKELALQTANHPNITWLNGAGDNLLAISRGEALRTFAGEPWVPDKLLLQGIIYVADRYKITINNLGASDRQLTEFISQGYLHPAGKAVDLNAATPIEGGTTTTFSFASSEQDITYGVTKAWMEAVKQVDPSKGAVGQKGCGGWFDIASKGIAGYHGGDSCNHLHLSLGNASAY